MRRTPLPALELVRLEPYRAGRSVQVLHVGSYDDEAPVLGRPYGRTSPSTA